MPQFTCHYETIRMFRPCRLFLKHSGADSVSLWIQQVQLRSYGYETNCYGLTQKTCPHRPSHPCVYVLLYFDNKQRLLTSYCTVLLARERNIVYLNVAVHI